MALPAQDELRRRLKAGRALRGLSVKELAARIPTESRLGERTLRKLESGEQALLPPTLRELAVALDVPYEWFTTDHIGTMVASDRAEYLARLDEVLEITRKLEQWESAPVWQRVVANQSELAGAIANRLERIENKLDGLDEFRREVAADLLERELAEEAQQPQPSTGNNEATGSARARGGRGRSTRR